MKLEPKLTQTFSFSEQQATEMANDTVYGLAAAVSAKATDSALAIGKFIRAGQSYLPGAYFNTSAPFGGFKQSGNGCEWGREGLKEDVESQAIFTGS